VHAPADTAVSRRDGAPGAPLRDGFGHHHRLRGLLHRRAELLVDNRPVGQVAGDAAGRPVDVVVAVERLKRSCCCGGGGRGLLCLLGVVGLEADLDTGEEEPAVRGDEGVGGVHGDVAAPAEQSAVLDAEAVGVALLIWRSRNRGEPRIRQSRKKGRGREKNSSDDERVHDWYRTWHMSQLGAAAPGGRSGWRRARRGRSARRGRPRRRSRARAPLTRSRAPSSARRCGGNDHAPTDSRGQEEEEARGRRGGVDRTQGKSGKEARGAVLSDGAGRLELDPGAVSVSPVAVGR
jgi:hypothetical protein